MVVFSEPFEVNSRKSVVDNASKRTAPEGQTCKEGKKGVSEGPAALAQLHGSVAARIRFNNGRRRGCTDDSHA